MQPAPAAQPSQAPAPPPPPPNVHAPQGPDPARIASSDAVTQAAMLAAAAREHGATAAIATRPAYAAPIPASLHALRKAVERNDMDALRHLLAAHPDAPTLLRQTIPLAHPRGPLPAGCYTLTMLAAAHGHAGIVTALLQAGAQVDARDGEGRTALMLAVHHRRLDAAEALLKAGADGDARAADGGTAVMLALARNDPGMADLLLTGAAGAHDLGERLRQAAARGYAATTRLLIAAGARMDRGQRGQMLLVFDVVGKGHAEIALMLLQARREAPVDLRPNLSIYEKDCVARDIQQLFVCNSRNDMSLPALQAVLRTSEGQATARADPLVLACAVRGARPAIVKALLEAGADPDKSESAEQVPLVLAIEQRSVENMRMLLDAGARPGLARRHYGSGMTLLQHAARHGNAEAVRLALSLGADACGDSRDIDAALLHACGHSDSVDAARLLLDAGADPNRESGDGRTPLYEAAQWGLKGMVALLLARKAQVDHVCRHKDNHWTALMIAACHGHTDTVRLLLEAGASRELEDARGRTALRLALYGRTADNAATADLLRTWTPAIGQPGS